MEILRQKQQIRLEILRRCGQGVLFLNYYSVQRHLVIEKLVTRTGFEGQERKHYRIRSARWYGGIVTADCGGCGLLCKFCWVSDAVMTRPANIGEFYTPKGIADELSAMAKKKRLNQLRVSGGEPTIGNRHLLQFLNQLAKAIISF